MTTQNINWGEVILGIGLISPLDEIAVGVVSGGTSTPTAPIQGVVSGLLGTYAILHGLKVIK